MAGRKRDPALDEAIVAAGAAVLAESGYAGFAVELVAQRLHIPKSTIYKRWPSRSHLVAHLASRRLALMSEIDPARVDDPRSALIHYLREDIALARSREGLAIAQAVLAARDTQRGDSDELVASAEHRRSGYVLLLSAAREQGRLPDNADVELSVDLLLGAIWGAVLWSRDRIETDAERLVDAVLALPPRDPG